MISKVKHKGARTWIEDVPAEEPVDNIWHFDGLPAAMRSVLKFKGVEKEYLDDNIFAAITAQPFRFWSSPLWEDCLAYTQEEPLGVVVAKVLGFDCYWHPGSSNEVSGIDVWQGQKKLNEKIVDEAWEELKSEIDAGHPVILFGSHPKADPKAGPVVVTGYDTEHQMIYFLPHSNWKPAPKWDDTDPECKNGIEEQGYRARRRPDETNWFGMQFAPVRKCAMGGAVISFFSFRKRTHKPKEHEVAIAVIRRAVSFARGNFHDEYRKHIRPGLGAFEFLIQILDQDREYYEYEGGKKHWNQIDCDWFFAMEGLVGPSFRKGASAFLEKCIEGFGKFSTEQKEHINKAVKAYDEANAQMTEFMKLFELVGPVEEYPARKETLRKALSSREFRRQAVEVLRKIRRAENHPISSLEKLLESEE